MQSLKQRKYFLGTRKFEFKDKQTLLVQHKNWRQHIQYMVDVVALSEKCGHRFAFSRYALIVFSVMLCITVMFQLLLSFNMLANNEWVQYGRNIFIVLSVINFLGILVSIRHERTFKTRYSKISVMWLFSGKPDQKSCKNFIQQIQKCIHERSKFLDLTLQQQSAGELKCLRRLLDEKIIEKQEYQQAKKRLLRLSDKNYHAA